MKELKTNKKYISFALVITIILILVYIFMSSSGTEITVKNFPKKVGEYRLTNVQTLENDSEIKAILGRRINETLISYYIGPGANVTLWALIPASFYKEAVIANMLVSSMSRKTEMFYSFNTITEGRYPLATFTGPGETLHNYIFFKNGKVFWLSIQSKGEVNERSVFKEFFNQF